MERRGFLKLVGLGGIAFAAGASIPSFIDWSRSVPLVASTLAPGDIPLSLEWMTREVALSLEQSAGDSFIHVPREHMVGDPYSLALREGRFGSFDHHFNVDFRTERVDGEAIDGREMSAQWLKPCGEALARSVKASRARVFSDLPLPKAVDGSYRLVLPSGISVRGVSQFVPKWQLLGDEDDSSVVVRGQARALRRGSPLMRTIVDPFDFVQLVRFDVLVG